MSYRACIQRARPAAAQPVCMRGGRPRALYAYAVAAGCREEQEAGWRVVWRAGWAYR